MQEKRLILIKYLDELRKKIIISALVVALGSILCYFYVDKIVKFLLKPGGGLQFIYLSPGDLFLTYIKISLIAGVVITLPILLYQIWQLILPSMKAKQKFYIILTNLLSMAFFITGAVFAYYIILPLTINFFIKTSRVEIEPLLSFDNYTGFVASILLAFGVAFQLPILIMLLTQFNLVTPSFLKKFRKVFILIIFVVAAILTPPDVISQCLLAIPMVILLELSIITSSLIYKRKKI